MHIDFLNTYLFGGAGWSSYRLYKGLLGKNIDLRFICRLNSDGFGKTKCRNVFQLDPVKTNIWPQRIFNSVRAKKYYRHLTKYLTGRPSGYEQFSFAAQFFSTPYRLFGELPDIIHLHWIAEWIDYSSFFHSIPKSVPVVWTLHDMNPFTGGCHYAWDCKKFTSDCVHCPQLGPYRDGDLASKSLDIKKTALAGKNLHVVADSTWLEREARSAVLFKGAESIRTIHYGIDTDLFRPVDRRIIRARYGIGENEFVMVAGAAQLENRRKGFRELTDACHILSARQIPFWLLLFGSHAGETELPNAIFTGPVSHEELPFIYSAGDVFVMPSLQEAFGLTVVEALACAIPVVAFDSGGISDSVRPDETGFLIPSGDVVGLAERLEWCIRHPARIESIKSRCRQLAVEEFSAAREVEQYMNLYRSLVS